MLCGPQSSRSSLEAVDIIGVVVVFELFSYILPPLARSTNGASLDIYSDISGYI